MFSKKPAAADAAAADPWRLVAWLASFVDVVHAKVVFYFARPMTVLSARLASGFDGGGGARGDASLLAHLGASVNAPRSQRGKPDFARAVDAFIYRMSTLVRARVVVVMPASGF